MFKRIWLPLFAFALGAACVLVPGCGSGGYDELRSLVGANVPDEWIAALVAEDPARFERMLDERGNASLIYLESDLNAAIRTGSLEEFTDSWQVVEPALTRVRRAMRVRSGYEAVWATHERFRALPMAEAYDAQRRWVEAHAAAHDPSLTEAARAAWYERHAVEIESLGLPVRTSLMWLHAASAHLKTDDTAAALSAYRRAAERGNLEDEIRVACQALGVLGVFYKSEGDFDRMRECWDQALQLSTRHHVGEQAGRILSLYASYYAARGEFDLARRLLYEAEQLSAAYGAVPAAARFLVDGLRFNANLECWEAVERGLPRAPLLLRRLQDHSADKTSYREYSGHVAAIRGRARDAAGDHEAANREFESALHAFEKLGYEDYAFGARVRWARSLISQDRAAEAIELLRPCVSPGDNELILPDAVITLAWAEADLGQWDACQTWLDRFDSLELADSSRDFARVVRAGELGARVQLARGDRDRAIAIIGTTCAFVDSTLAEREASQESFLVLRGLKPLHELLHELLEAHPRLALELELAWRKVPLLLGTGGEFGRSDSPLEACRNIVARANAGEPPASPLTLVEESELPPGGELQILYRLGPTSLERWVRAGDRMAHVTTAVDPGNFRKRVNGLLESLGREVDEGVGVDDALRNELREIALLLLPEPVLAGAAPAGEQVRHLRLFPGNVLSGFPFGVLNLSDDGYVPLVSRFDPVNERSQLGSAPSGSKRGPGLIIADPKVSASLAAWTSGLPRLPHGLQEARSLHEMEPETVLLEGEAATAKAVRRHWGQAGLIYFASHVVTDPSSPYLSYIPLAEQELARGQALVKGNEYLNILDIRSARFRAQPFVVLSACSSGAPYQTRGALAPSLADAFIDAGASTVISNLWSVRDDAAAELMQRTMRTWSVEGADPDCALNEARREMASAGRFMHPYFWGATIVQVRGR